MNEPTDGERLERGDIWSNTHGWQGRDDAARDMARQMLPAYRWLWQKHIGTEIGDDDLIDKFVEWGLTPLHAALGG